MRVVSNEPGVGFIGLGPFDNTFALYGVGHLISHHHLLPTVTKLGRREPMSVGSPLLLLLRGVHTPLSAPKTIYFGLFW